MLQLSHVGQRLTASSRLCSQDLKAAYEAGHRDLDL